MFLARVLSPIKKPPGVPGGSIVRMGFGLASRLWFYFLLPNEKSHRLGGSIFKFFWLPDSETLM
jgi:hypothetical protein